MVILKKKWFKITASVLLLLVVAWTILNVIPPSKVSENNPFIRNEGQGPMLAAHQGGNNLNPGNTFLAFDYAIENYDIDILELDLCLTKDNYLVSVHDSYLNDTTDVEEVTGTTEKYYVKDHTLEELLQFNFGAKFEDRDGLFPYKDLVSPNQENRDVIIREAKLSIVTIDEIFSAYYQSDLMFIVEIKDRGQIGERAADILYSLIMDEEKYPNSKLIRRVAVGTFHDEISAYLESFYPKLLRGGSRGEVSDFITYQMLGINIFNKSSFDCMQIPMADYLGSIPIALDRLTYINRAHRRNIAVQYWTINDEESMIELISKNVDAIMTDDPDVLYKVLKEMGFR